MDNLCAGRNPYAGRFVCREKFVCRKKYKAGRDRMRCYRETMVYNSCLKIKLNSYRMLQHSSLPQRILTEVLRQIRRYEFSSKQIEFCVGKFTATELLMPFNQFKYILFVQETKPFLAARQIFQNKVQIFFTNLSMSMANIIPPGKEINSEKTIVVDRFDLRIADLNHIQYIHHYRVLLICFYTICFFYNLYINIY